MKNIFSIVLVCFFLFINNRGVGQVWEILENEYVKYDSVIGYRNKSIYFNYDTEDNLLTIFESEFDKEGKLIRSGPDDEFIFDNNGNKIFKISHIYNKKTKKYIPKYKDEFRYDKNNNLILKLKFELDKNSNKYIPNSYGSKYEYVNDKFGNKVQEFIYSWDTVSLEFRINDNYSKYTFEYNTENKLTLKSTFHWGKDENKFILGNRTKYNYDENKNKKEQLFFITYNGKEFLDSKYIFEYDLEGNLIKEVRYRRFTNSDRNKFGDLFEVGKIIPTEKTEYQYDEFKNKILEKRYSWDFKRNKFITYYKFGFSKLESVYDHLNVMISFIKYDWDNITESLVFDEKMSRELIKDDNNIIVYKTSILEYDKNFHIWKQQDQFYEYCSPSKK
tara:strand:- start:580 stop:1746 length:1167 start_codon:yes stop_codon:yes gene_type:complete